MGLGKRKKITINQPCLVNLLHPRLRDTAFVFKLRPLGNNPVEHTGLQFAQRRLNTESCLWICRLPPASHSLFASPSVKCHHRCKQRQSLPYIHGSGCKCFFSHLWFKFKSSHEKSFPAPGDVSARQLTSRPGKHCEKDLSRASQRSPQSSRAALTSSSAGQGWALQKARGAT